MITQKHSILDAWKGSEYACVQIAPGNVLCHHNKYLMGYFEFLHGSRIICLPLNISIKLHWQYVFEKRQRAIAFIFDKTIQHSRTLKNNIYHSNKREPLPFFHPDTNPVIGQVLVHFVDKTHALVVTVELIWFLFFVVLEYTFFQLFFVWVNRRKDEKEL